ncbi:MULTISPECIES: thioesterase domain-containing protein [unclassified Arthrobacter]|uniref:thioesterase domain-containing protein n=1 Tax=unclassified Arthrobacter TaxID=235627 RepID=UPI001492A231|nr:MULTISPECIES: thioesterase domain-containing protein [unclassified Arthrobacter]MBE0008286.1 alpha/beta hydrolase [Arthrobacter sp. AET 35A]NOJ61575.1 alpha/beta hydrolase [Arthrobacter sp. 260]NOJ62025.1 alpha/beta hydrolase [Arthrobacter sp. 147(2020)]
MTEDAERLLRYAHGIKGMSRRSFIAGSAFGLTLAADLFLTRQIQEEREELQILPVEDAEAARRFPRTRWIIFPGYKTGWEEGGWIANSLQPALSQRGQIAVMGYSNRGLNVANIVAALNRYVRIFQVETLYFYGHSFGGMVAIEVASQLRGLGIAVELIILDSSPHSRDDVLDQAVFEGVVFLYDAGYRVPTVLRGSYELGERIVNKNERTWRQILNQTLEQLSPLAPSSVLIQSQSSYIYHYNVTRFQETLGDTQIAFIGNPNDGTVNYARARPGWAEAFPDNLVSADYVTEGALPAHASPQWNPLIYQSIVVALQDEFLPLPQGGSLRSAY